MSKSFRKTQDDDYDSEYDKNNAKRDRELRRALQRQKKLREHEQVLEAERDY